MKSKENNRQFIRPVNMNPRVWDVLKKVAKELWKEYDNTASVKRKVMISCKEFYEMLLDENGSLILNNKELIHFANNNHIKSWSKELLIEGVNLLANGVVDHAIEKLQLHLMLNPKSVGGKIQLAEAFQLKGAYRKALTQLNDAVHLAPENETVYLKRAGIYTMLDADERAMNDLNFTLLLNPKSIKALHARAQLNIAKGQINSAMTDIEKVETIAPDYIATSMLRGEVFFQEKKWPKAYKAFKQVLHIEPHNAEAIVRIAQIKLEFKVEVSTAKSDLLFARALGHPKAEQLLIQNFEKGNKGWMQAA